MVMMHALMTRALTATLTLAVVASGCASSAGSAPAPVAPTPPAMDIAFVWQDLVTTDLAAARAFYGELLGWQFDARDRAGRTYAVARTSAGPVGGLVDVRDITGATSQWVSYLSVPDVDRTVQLVEAAGGKVLVAPMATAAGRAGVVVDAQGAAFGLLQPSRAPPAVPRGTPLAAHFFWREYLAQDAAKARAFYRGVVGFEAESEDTASGIEYFVLRRNGPRGGLLQIPAAMTQVRPHWLPYVLVSDPAAAARKATSLGGRVLLDVSPDRRNGTLAVIADPTGGVVALQKFPL